MPLNLAMLKAVQTGPMIARLTSERLSRPGSFSAKSLPLFENIPVDFVRPSLHGPVNGTVWKLVEAASVIARLFFIDYWTASDHLSTTNRLMINQDGPMDPNNMPPPISGFGGPNGKSLVLLESP